MNPLVLMLTEITLSIAISVGVLYALSRPLVNLLARLCPDKDGAEFWLRYTNVMLIIAPLLLVLVVDLFSSFSDPLDTMRLALIAVLCGLLLGLFIIGLQLGQFGNQDRLPPRA